MPSDRTGMPPEDLSQGEPPDLTGVALDLRMSMPDLRMGQPDFSVGQCTANPSYGNQGLKMGVAQSRSMGQSILWESQIGTGSPMDFISLQLYSGAGAFTGGAIRTGTFQITGDELNYATCGVCVLIYTDFNMGTMMTTHAYLATSGSVTLTSVSGQITGSINNVSLQHVQIDEGTFQSTPDPSGCTSSVTGISFNDMITPM